MVRAGSRTLSIFTNALNARVLHAHADGSRTPRELEETLGWAPQSSLRAAVAKLSALGAIDRAGGEGGSPGAPTELTAAGRELLPVASALEKWLQNAPGGPVPLEDPAAQGIVRVLTAGWDSTMIRALAEQPQSLIALSASISELNYPALKRRLGKLRTTRLIAPIEHEDGAAYVATDWLRQAVLPLTLAGRWERKHDHDAQPISQIEVEAAFLLALPLIELQGRSTGACALAVLMSEESRSKRSLASVSVDVKQGAIASYDTNRGTNEPTWALGTIDAWLDALVEGRKGVLRIGGAKPRIAESIVKGLHIALFRS